MGCRRRKRIERATERDQWLFLGLVCRAVRLHVACLWRCNVTAMETVCWGPCPWWWTHPLQSPHYPYHVSAYTHIQWCVEKHHNPQALQHSATYIWCWRVQGVGLAQASLPPADSVGGFMWHAMCVNSWALLLRSFLRNKFPQLCKVHTNLYTIAFCHMNTHVQIVGIHSYLHSDFRTEPNKSCITSGLMTSCPLLIQLHP